MLDKMRDPKLAHAKYLSSQGGAKAAAATGAANAQVLGTAHADTVGLLATNDMLAEGTFGTFTYTFNRYNNISVDGASGVAQAKVNGDFALKDPQLRKRTETALRTGWEEGDHGMGKGLFHNLSEKEQLSLLDMARQQLGAAIARMRSVRAKHDRYWAEKREQARARALEKMLEIYIDAQYYFEMYNSDARSRSAMEVHSNITFLKKTSEARVLNYLKDQILMRVVGLGWGEFKCAWSSSTDASVGTIKTLTEHLLKILEAEATKVPPAEAACPQLKRKTLPQLGRATVKVEQLDSKGSDDVNNLKAAAEEERLRREAAGIGDRVQNLQPIQPPAFDEDFIGKHIEVRYKYAIIDPVTKEPTGEDAFLWCAAQVMQVSDGSLLKKGKKGQALKSKHPAGHALLRWEANAAMGEDEESESWMGLLPSKWNTDQLYAWRRDPDYGMWVDHEA